jgi:hypothetical protein
MAEIVQECMVKTGSRLELIRTSVFKGQEGKMTSVGN